MSTYYTLLTNVGLAKMMNAQALGTIVQWSAMAVGDGNGNPTTPTQAQTALVREKYRAPLNQLSIDPANPNYLIAEMIIPATEGGWTVHEVGLFDADGDMVAVANFPMTYKPVLADGSTRDLVIRIIIEVSNAATVQLKIDPAVVLASRQWVMTNYVEKVTLSGGTTNQVLRKKTNADLDVEWADPMAAVQVIVVSREETQTLAALQTVVDLAVVTTDGCAVYIEGVRLLASQFTRTSPTRVTLGSAYPAGTKITIVQNEETGDYPQATEVQKGIAEIATQSETDSGTDDSRMVTPAKMAASMQKGSGKYAVAAGTSSALTASLAPIPASLSSIIGSPLMIKIASLNPGAATLNLNGLGAKSIVNPSGDALVQGQLITGAIATLIYDGTNFQLQSVQSGFGTHRMVVFGVGTTSWVCPPGVYFVKASGWGAGGTGASGNGSNQAGAGGGAGGYGEGWYPVVPGTSYSAVVGAAATPPATASTTGLSGGVTSFGAFLSCGGGGGGAVFGGAGGVGGVVTGAQFLVTGNAGSSGAANVGGHGGSPFGSGPAFGSTLFGNPAQGPGGAGSGALAASAGNSLAAHGALKLEY